MRMPVASRTRVGDRGDRREHVSGSSHGASGGTGNLPHAYFVGVRAHHDVVDDDDPVDAGVVGDAREVDEPVPLPRREERAEVRKTRR